MLPVLKEKLNYLQNNEEGQENNSMIQEIQESEIFSRIEDEKLPFQKNSNEQELFSSKNENEYIEKLQKNENSFRNDEHQIEEKSKIFQKKREEFDENEFARKIEMRISVKMEEKINERINEYFNNFGENERKIKLIERKLLAFEEVLNDINFFKKLMI